MKPAHRPVLFVRGLEFRHGKDKSSFGANPHEAFQICRMPQSLNFTLQRFVLPHFLDKLQGGLYGHVVLPFAMNDFFRNQRFAFIFSCAIVCSTAAGSSFGFCAVAFVLSGRPNIGRPSNLQASA